MTEPDAAGKNNLNAIQGKSPLVKSFSSRALWGGGILILAILGAYESYGLYRFIVWFAS